MSSTSNLCCFLHISTTKACIISITVHKELATNRSAGSISRLTRIVLAILETIPKTEKGKYNQTTGPKVQEAYIGTVGYIIWFVNVAADFKVIVLVVLAF